MIDEPRSRGAERVIELKSGNPHQMSKWKDIRVISLPNLINP
jgi:hypothetical protein